jgi:hypothetical protein
VAWTSRSAIARAASKALCADLEVCATGYTTDFRKGPQDMKLTEAKREHHCYRDKNDVRIVQFWNQRMEGKPGKPVLPEPGDGLRLCNREKVAPGYVLYSPDHSNKFLLLDLDGKIVHEWPAWTSHFGYLLPNGHLVLDTEFSPDKEWGIIELDWDGNEVWSCPCQVHHDFQRLENGNTLVLCERGIVDPKVAPGKLLSTYVLEVTPDREIVWEWYSEDHTEELTRLLGIRFPRDRQDWTHTNTVQALPETPASADPRFRAGNVILSHRELDCALIVDKDSGEIVWAWGPGTLSRQHATIVLENGHMLCFDNGRDRRASAIWELDLLTGKIVWSYEGNEKAPFHAAALSNAQRLPNGNTFICSGSRPDHGRLFEVTPEGEIVWDFQNPYAEHAEGEKIVYRAYKYPPEMIEPFLRR